MTVWPRSTMPDEDFDPEPIYADQSIELNGMEQDHIRWLGRNAL